MKLVKPTNKLYVYLTAFFLVQIMLIAFYPANRTEVDDGFWYAAGIRDEPYLKLFNPRFFLFLPLFKALYELVSLTGLRIDAYHFMCAVSMIFAGLTLVLLYDILRQYMHFKTKTAFFIVALLAISYQFWRYSVEAEVYVLSMFLIVLILKLCLKLKESASWHHVLLLCILGAFTTLLYKPNFIPLYAVFPAIFLYYKRYKAFIVYYALSAVFIVGSFFIVYLQLPEEGTFLTYLFGGTNHPVGNPAVSVLVITSNILSLMWIFGFEEATTFIIDKFPHKVIQEELFLAQQIGREKYLLLGVLCLLALLFIILVVNAIRRRDVFKMGRFRILAIMALWVLVYGGFLLLMDPTSNEPWLMLQIPILVFFGAILIEPLSKSLQWIAPTFLVLVFINNTVGGMNLLRQLDYDYYYKKSEWLINNATGDDYIISYGPMSFIRYLRYYTDAEILNMEEGQGRALTVLKTPEKVSGEIYLSENIFHPPPAIMYRSQVNVVSLFKLYEEKGYRTELISGEGDRFATYKLIMK
ncbi:hypothetical protein C900_04194 [Fulvivirga imtechensis AK7]|uniref:Glycosyltransferase RgtA/B/C/D-like domain-containing protein n=1 Tax=Fulvivirga imtechensis AK7 TaxID=1237149 RepID=L8K1L7_9BACT|nr:DUF2723 domain-containing protein [Fulvivirga imtechensis]ELR73342.1 hypothetical protein C900_04194 [Fulvivirga imtechensis AK7]